MDEINQLIIIFSIILVVVAVISLIGGYYIGHFRGYVDGREGNADVWVHTGVQKPSTRNKVEK